MLNLLRAMLSSMGRFALLFLVVLSIIIVIPSATQRIQQAINEFDQGPTDISALEAAENSVHDIGKREIGAAVERVNGLERAASKRIEQRIHEIDREIQALEKATYESPIEIRYGVPRPNPRVLKQQALAKTQQSILKQERAFLEDLLQFREKLESHLRSEQESKKELETRRRAHETAYKALQENEERRNQLLTTDPLEAYIPLTTANARLNEIGQERKVLLANNLAAHKAWEAQNNHVDGLKAPKRGGPFELTSLDLESFTAQMRDERERLKNELGQNWFGKAFAGVRDRSVNALPLAIPIVLGILFVPMAIKVVLYFVLAPLASRRPAVALLPTSSGAIDPLGDADHGDDAPVSSVSRAVTIDADSELLVHQEYLQSSPHESANDTKWLLNGRYWLASIAAGLYGLTRMRSESPVSVVLSATRDPLSEVGTVVIPEGSAVVLQPRHLVGVLQRRDQPLRITGHWRLASLHAWLTLQLRYLVFHGPVTLIVKGCRGVRLEPAEPGRSINQAAMIGFSANLGYSSRRSETFFGYWNGKQPLFNDSFSGTSGKFLYQEMPHAGGRSGVTGRGLEGVIDAFLKVFGV